jgi:hypothetical protein
MSRSTLALLVVAVVAVTAAPGLAAPKPKPITQSVPFTDTTPDYSGWAVGPDSHCAGLLPREEAYEFKAPAAGSLKVSISGFTGEWALDLRDAKGNVLAETDVLAPEQETLTIKLRRPGVVNIGPCNLAGTPEALISLVFTYA